MLTAALAVDSPKPPQAPSAPFLSSKKPIEKQAKPSLSKLPYSYPGSVLFDLASIHRGRIFFSTNAVAIRYTFKGISYDKVLNLKEIKSIYFIKWQGREYTSNGFVFSPQITDLEDRLGNVYRLHHPLALFHQMTLTNSRGVTHVYAYFYDYWQRGKWKHSQSKNKSYPERHPLKRVVKKIIFD